MFLRKNFFFFWTFYNLVANFFYVPMLPLTLFFICRHDYSFVSGKNRYSVKDSLFLRRRAQSKNKQLLRQIFPWINFLIKHFLIITFKPQEVLNKLTGRHIRESQKHKKNDQILSLRKSLASFFTNGLCRVFHTILRAP